MQKYSDAIDTACNLSYVPHWVIGTAACVVGMLLENGNAFANHSLLGSAAFCLFCGIVFSVISRLLMGVFPWPYAWLARTLNQGSAD